MSLFLRKHIPVRTPFSPLLREFPPPATLAAQTIVATFNTNRFTVYKGIGNFSPAFYQYTLKGGAGNFHVLGTFFLLQAQVILEADRLRFLHQQYYLLQTNTGNACWFK